jgi:hypothetical protein
LAFATEFAQDPFFSKALSKGYTPPPSSLALQRYPFSMLIKLPTKQEINRNQAL